MTISSTDWRGPAMHPSEAAVSTPGTIDAATLYRAHAPFVAGFVARLGLGHADVADVVQEVFLVAHRRGGYVPGPAKPTTWLAEIALRTVSTRRRTQRRKPEHSDPLALDALVAHTVSPSDAAEHQEDLVRVQHALDAVPLERRAVFVLFEIDGIACADIATGLGVPISTIYSRLHIARQEFMHSFERLSASGSDVRPANGDRP